MTDKKSIRARCKKVLSNLDDESKSNYSLKITEKVVKLLKEKNIKKVNVYNSFQNEVQTDKLIEKLSEENFEISLPVICGEELVGVTLNKQCEFKVNEYGIYEPIGEVSDDFQAVVVPMLAFDRSMTRLGRGKGFYDRFLQNKSIFKIGLAYSVQEEKVIPCENFDIKMDVIVTEKEVIEIEDNKRKI